LTRIRGQVNRKERRASVTLDPIFKTRTLTRISRIDANFGGLLNFQASVTLDPI